LRLFQILCLFRVSPIPMDAAAPLRKKPRRKAGAPGPAPAVAEAPAAAGPESDADQADSEWLPVEYETRAAHDALPWQDAVPDLSRVEATEEGFCGLEEIPAGSYDIERTAGGGIVIRVRKGAGGQGPAVPAEAPAQGAGAGVKRKRGAESGAPATGEARGSTPADEPHDVAPVPLDPADVAAEWGSLGLHPLLLAAVGRLGFARPTRIQREAVSVGGEGRRVVCPCAQGWDD